MKRIQQGNDITIKWTITKNEDVSLEDTQVVLVDALKKNALFKYKIEDNVITGKFYGKDQRTLGIYTLMLVNNAGEKNMSTLIHPNVFNLVKKLDNKIACGEDDDNIVTETLEITSDITTGWATDLTDYFTKEEVNQIIDERLILKTINGVSLIGEGNIVLENNYDVEKENIVFKGDNISTLTNDSGYISEIPEYVANKDDIPTKVSQLENDADFATNQALQQLQPKLTDNQSAAVNSGITKEKLENIEQNLFSGDYNDLTNKPTIPDVTNLTNKVEQLESIDHSKFLTEHQSLADYALKSELFSKDYNDLTNKPNLEEYATQNWVESQNYLTQHQDLSEYVLKNDFDTAVNNWEVFAENVDAELEDLKLYKFPNLTIFGQPTIQSGQMGGFTSNSYAQFPFLVDFRNQPFEINMCFTTGVNVTNQENILDSLEGLALAIRNGKFVVAMSSNGSTWDMGEHIGNINVQPNTTYYLKFSWNSAVYKLSVSLDKDVYTDDIVYNDTKSLFAKQIVIGKSVDNTHIFSGTINLNYCNLIVNSNQVWQGMDDVGIATRLATDLSNIDEAGQNKINSIVSYYVDNALGNVESLLSNL